MATSPLGGFANLARYQQAVANAPRVDPLTSALQGFQTGQVLQNLPEIIAQQQQDQALQRLQNELQVQLLQQRVADARNPTGALIRQVQEQLALRSTDPTTGIVAAPVGLQGETIGVPAAITPEQQAVLVSGGAVPTAAAGVPVEPVTIAGLPTGFMQDLGRATAATEALSRARGSTALERQLLANAQREADRLSREQIAADANASRERVAQTRSAGVRGSMTEGQRAGLLQKYGAVQDAVGDLEQFQDENGNTDYSKLSVAVGRAQAAQKKAELDAKASGLSASAKRDVAGWISAQKDLENLKANILGADGRVDEADEPGVIQNAFAVMANNPSQGFFSSLSRQFANSQLKESTRRKEIIRAGLDAAIKNALSGKAVTASEERTLTGLLPKSDDTLKGLLDKTSGLEAFLQNKLAGISEAETFGGGAPSAPATPPPSGKIRIVAPDGTVGNWPANRPLPEGFTAAP